MAYRGKLKITNISDKSIVINMFHGDRWGGYNIKNTRFLICDGPDVSFEELAGLADKGYLRVQRYPKPLSLGSEPELVAEIVEVSRFELMEID